MNDAVGTVLIPIFPNMIDEWDAEHADWHREAAALKAESMGGVLLDGAPVFDTADYGGHALWVRYQMRRKAP